MTARAIFLIVLIGLVGTNARGETLYFSCKGTWYDANKVPYPTGPDSMSLDVNASSAVVPMYEEMKITKVNPVAYWFEKKWFDQGKRGVTQGTLDRLTGQLGLWSFEENNPNNIWPAYKGTCSPIQRQF
jgi:hypothetical protein